MAASSFGEDAKPYEWLQSTSTVSVSSDDTAPRHSDTAQRSTQHAEHVKGTRNVYSFCMCPGGQVVPTSVEEGELCVNGMSFSRRDSRWANSALVVAVGQNDWQPWVVRSPVYYLSQLTLALCT